MKSNELNSERKIKIIHIAQSAGGVAEYLKELLKRINNDKYTNILIVSNDYKGKEEVIKLSKKSFFVDMVREINIKKSFKAIKEIKKILKQEKPDIVYLHSSMAGALGRIALLFNRKVKIIYNAHGWYFNADIGKKKEIYRIIEKILAFKADKIIAISKSEYNSALEKGICKENKLILIENGVDLKKYADVETYRTNMKNKYNLDEKDIVIGIVGRISEQKDPMTSIKAAAKIIKEKSNIYFMFVGTGELEKQVLNYAQNQKIEDHIIITGWVDNVKPYISTFDIALLPSKWEGFGLAIVEYMTCKKPIITTKLGGIADILNKEGAAFFIEKENENDIVKHIKYILNNEENIKIMVEDNYKHCAERFDIEREVKQHEILFEELLNKREK